MLTLTQLYDLGKNEGIGVAGGQVKCAIVILGGFILIDHGAHKERIL